MEFVPSDDLHSLVRKLYLYRYPNVREDHNDLAPDCEWRGKQSQLLEGLQDTWSTFSELAESCNYEGLADRLSEFVLVPVKFP